MNPARTCKAERTQLSSGAFNDKWGTNPNKRNAFGMCVSHYAKLQQSS